MKNKGLCFLLFICFVMLITGCSYSPKKVTIGMVPYDNSVKLVNDFEPVREYLQKEMGVSVEVTVPSDYLGLIETMKQKKVDIGWYGPFSYIAGESEVNLEPLVVQYRKGSGTSYYSLIITRKDSGIKTIEDIKGKKFAFVDPGSTSGFVIPFALFESRDIDIRQYFNDIKYSGTHDSVAMDVMSGKVDAGAMDDIVFTQMADAGKLKKDDIIVVWKSDAIPGSPYAARAGMNKKLKDSFKAAMLSIHEKAPRTLNSYDARAEKYVECDNSSYNVIRNIAKILGEDFIIEKFLKKK